MTRLFRAFLALSVLLASPLAAQMSFTNPGTTGGGGSGTVTTVGVTTANGVSGTVANPTTTPSITVTLGAITPSSVASTGTVTGTNLSGTHSGSSSGTNTGDQTITLTGDVTGTGTGSFAATIPAGTITLGKQANLAANSIVGNNTGSSATPLALTVAQTKTLLAISSADVSGLAATATSTSATNLTGTLNAAQLPALTGDATTSAGSAATSVVSATGNGTDFVVASPNRIKVSGNATAPTPATTDGYLFHNTNNGLGLAGNGANFDLMLIGSGGSSLVTIAHGGSTLAISPGGLSAAGSILSSGGTSGIGYATGAGGTVTQLTSRATGVTNNKACGAITLFSAAGSATYSTFTVTDSAVAATDVIVANQKSGTDKYIVLVTAVAAGSFNLSLATTGGTTTEQPVIQYCAIKGVNA